MPTAVVIVTVGMNTLRQTQQVSTSTRVLGLHPLARSRLNAVLIIAATVTPAAAVYNA